MYNPTYYILALFEDRDLPEVVVLQDDYTAVYDFHNHFIGSNLTDANEGYLDEATMVEQLMRYITDMSDDVAVIYTNDMTKLRVWLYHNLRSYHRQAWETRVRLTAPYVQSIGQYRDTASLWFQDRGNV